MKINFASYRQKKIRGSSPLQIWLNNVKIAKRFFAKVFVFKVRIVSPDQIQRETTSLQPDRGQHVIDFKLPKEVKLRRKIMSIISA